jgi:hypothetical protein
MSTLSTVVDTNPDIPETNHYQKKGSREVTSGDHQKNIAFGDERSGPCQSLASPSKPSVRSKATDELQDEVSKHSQALTTVTEARNKIAAEEASPATLVRSEMTPVRRI